MKHILTPALVGLVGLALLATPAFAHQGMMHDGCPAGQTFTAGEITVSGAFTRATLPQAKVGGGYLTIENKGTTTDRLIGGSSGGAKAIQVHQMKMEGDVMKMGEVEGGLEIPAGSTVTLAPGGDSYHLMLMDLAQPLRPNECLNVTLNFEKAGELPIQLLIGAPNADAPAEGEHMNHDMMMAPAQ